MNLVLGTAALGFPYGVCNKSGKLQQKEVTKIIETAWECGIGEFDTAQAYRDSERFLGQAFKDLGIRDQVRVITKINPHINPTSIPDIIGSLDYSSSLLGVVHLEGVLFHREYDIDIMGERTTYILPILRSFLEDLNPSMRIGVSVYHPDYAVQTLNVDEIDIVQFPGNVLDRRFENLGVFDLAKRMGKQIYLRNIFLQGVLLADPEELPENVKFMKIWIKKLEDMAKKYKMARLDFVIGFLKRAYPDAKLIFGAETSKQIKEVTEAWKGPLPESVSVIQEVFSDVGDKVLIPKLWGLMK